MRFSNEDDVMPDLDPNLKRRNWLVLVVLGALAAFSMSPSCSSSRATGSDAHDRHS